MKGKAKEYKLCNPCICLVYSLSNPCISTHWNLFDYEKERKGKGISCNPYICLVYLNMLSLLVFACHAISQ